MTEQEKRSYLCVKVENELYRMLQALKEMNLSGTDLEKEQLKAIINFINRLPEEYREIPNYESIIIQSLENLGVKTTWGDKKKEEIKHSKRNNVSKSKTRRNTKEKDEIDQK